MSMDYNAFTVSALNAYLKSRIEGDELLQCVYVKGEISNYKYHTSGHHYFSLKDSECSIRCVLFKNNAFGMRFRPENGLKVILCGKVSAYTRDGTCQINCQKMIPEGAGELQIAFEQLKNRLSKEGFFDAAYKKSLPRFPKRIAVITSRTGAVVHDIINILNKRWPLADVLVVPVSVQGQDAPSDISSAIRYVNQYSLADLIITGRGGGSIEDLWAFNTEEVCRAIFSSEIPVISAVGHEPDVTLSDFVADLRASTPSNAAELAVPDTGEMREKLSSACSRLVFGIEKQVSSCRRDLDLIRRRPAFSDPSSIYQEYRQDLDHLSDDMVRCISDRLGDWKNTLNAAGGRLKALNPRSILSRGFALALIDGKTVSSVTQLHENDTFSLVLSDGSAECEVKRLLVAEQ